MPTEIKSWIRDYRAAAFGLTLLWLIVALGIAHSLRIPLGNSAPFFMGLYVAMSAQSVLYAIALMAIESPSKILGHTWAKFRQKPPKLVIYVALVVFLFVLYPAKIAVLLSLFALILLEAYEGRPSLDQLKNLLLPGVYIFAMLLAVFASNAICVTLRFGPTMDHVLASIDSYLLLGRSVAGLSHEFMANAPAWLLSSMQLLYFSLFPQIGAVLVLCAVAESRNLAMRFVTTLAIAYAISVAIFFLIPSHSPYYSHAPDPAISQRSEIPEVQSTLRQYAEGRAQGKMLSLTTEYYIAFPCMHIAQPLIVLWFVARWRRIAVALALIDVGIVAAIILLEWHYFTDLLGGILVAWAAISIVRRLDRHHDRMKEPIVTTAATVESC